MTRIKRYRLKQSLTQKQLSSLSGITARTIISLENCAGRKTQARIQRNIAAVFAVPPEKLFTKDGIAR